ncbi:cytosine permease [Microbacterium amylolyticum]|uniref:cytosine permease n=1 Tax=Microbacterium amylolyticum TaxID=936337 RepID=UPI00360D25DD
MFWYGAQTYFASVASLFANDTVTGWSAVAAFVGVVGLMVAYFSAVIINYGDFSRFSRSEKSMRLGNFLGLPVSLAFFSFLSLFITAGAYDVSNLAPSKISFRQGGYITARVPWHRDIHAPPPRVHRRPPYLRRRCVPARHHPHRRRDDQRHRTIHRPGRCRR